MKKLLILITTSVLTAISPKAQTIPFDEGKLKLQVIAENAVRIQYEIDSAEIKLPEWIYVSDKCVKSKVQKKGPVTTVKTAEMEIRVNQLGHIVEIYNAEGKCIFTATEHQLLKNMVAGEVTNEATLSMQTSPEEMLFGLGQFQDGETNINGWMRRLTQVNTQISIPMFISNRGYGVLWNNYGLTEWNPADNGITMTNEGTSGNREVVNVTTTTGGRQEVRTSNIFVATLQVPSEGDYALLLDVGQIMARRHNLQIDGNTIINMQNLWLPPTASARIHLTAGEHKVRAELSSGDSPKLFYRRATGINTFYSPVANAVDYTVFVGTPDEVIATYRNVTGKSPMIPRWALGYIHCRERFHSSDEILQTAQRFRKENLPVDMLVQDWQWWGKYGWNAMQFDEDFYPDPRLLTDSLHSMNIRLMLSVWSKIDVNSKLGKQMKSYGYYINGTDWIDFFNPEAAKAYWSAFNERLVPTGIDAWWQDATEPENDDLLHRRVNNGQWAGERVRNIYPLLVNRTVYEGLKSSSKANSRSFILTRCGFAGQQRYGSALWSGDVGNDWETFRRQITAGLGIQAAGIPWWTYDAGGFFRPGNQYTDADYAERLMRWIQTSVYLPLMRVHGYMSNTEPWNYSDETQKLYAQALRERYHLLPYICSQAAEVCLSGYTLMRPLVFDFTDDPTALKQKHQYMFGKSLLVSPITEPKASTWETYLPQNEGGWYDFHNNKQYNGGTTVTTEASNAYIPVFVKAGSIVPTAEGLESTTQLLNVPLELTIYPGADATFTLHEDDGTTLAYDKGEHSEITFKWNDRNRCLTIDQRKGNFASMPKTRIFRIHVVNQPVIEIEYKGSKIQCHKM